MPRTTWTGAVWRSREGGEHLMHIGDTPSDPEHSKLSFSLHPFPGKFYWNRLVRILPLYYMANLLAFYTFPIYPQVSSRLEPTERR